jgi:broad specificity phosphatase PhoE
MKTIITVQHPQSIHHTNGMIGSWTDWDLSDFGIEQAKRIGERLSQEIKDKNYVLYSSDLLRAKHTAEIVAGFLGIEPKYTSDLRELNLGEAVGKSEEWAHKNTIVWMKTIDDKPFIGSESKRDVWDRLLNFHNQIMASNEENIIIISHGGTLSIFYAVWLGLDVEMLNKCDLLSSSGGLSFLGEDSDKKRIISRLNDRSYVS